jgi:hypothetical protein
MKTFFSKRPLVGILTILISIAFSANGQNTSPWPSTGSIGIGTTTPGAPLEIKNNCPATGKNLALKLTNGWNGSNPNNEPTIFFDNGGGTAQWFMGASVAGGDYFRISRNATYSGAVNPGLYEYFRISANGNVGIGTSTPNAPLQFANTTVNRKMVLWETANNDHQFYGLGVNSAILRYQVDGTSSNHVFYAATSSSASNELMRIKGNGYVGINTSSPTAMLHVNGSAIIGSTTLTPTTAFDLASNKVVLGNQTTYGGGYIEVNGSGNYGYNIVSKSNLALNNSAPTKLFVGLNTNATKEVFGVYSNGQTYIGPQIISSSSIHTDYKLSVDGKIVAKSIYVLLPTGGDWADYVFQDNYKLTPLKEIETFVKRNKHLPEIPSAREIEENGINLGQMDALLLKKIEELTLHMIRIEKENENLKKQIEEIKK